MDKNAIVLYKGAIEEISKKTILVTAAKAIHIPDCFKMPCFRMMPQTMRPAA